MANEKRLIDANALDASITVDYYEHFTQCHDTDQIALIDMVREDIGNAPTVDAVEVVRCKYCKHRYSPNNQKRKPFCTKQFVMDARDDDFCSYGERKDNG